MLYGKNKVGMIWTARHLQHHSGYVLIHNWTSPSLFKRSSRKHAAANKTCCLPVVSELYRLLTAHSDPDQLCGLQTQLYTDRQKQRWAAAEGCCLRVWWSRMSPFFHPSLLKGRCSPGNFVRSIKAKSLHLNYVRRGKIWMSLSKSRQIWQHSLS